MPMKVLLVEDNEVILRLLAMCLQQGGLVVEQARNALEALQKLEDETFDVVVSDLRLPGINGLDLARRVLDNFGGIPIVIMTGDTRARRMESIDEAGVSCVLIKPFQVHELVNSIRRVLPEKTFS
jgi:CheY-like chemotaxis protein